MDNRDLISTHVLKSDYSVKGRLKGIIIGWGIFLVIFIISRLSNVQLELQNLQADWEKSVTWVGNVIEFIRNGLWVCFIPLVIGTIMQLRKKHPFKSLLLYKEGIGFLFNDEEKFCDYSKINLSMGKMAQSFYITCSDIEIKNNEYAFGEFSQPDVLMSNLKRYSKISS